MLPFSMSRDPAPGIETRDFRAMTGQEFRAALRLRLVAEDTVDPANCFRASEAFAEGVLAVFALETPEGSVCIPDHVLEHHGGAHALRPTALRNTLSHQADACIAIRSDPKDNLPLGSFLQLSGRSHHVAGSALDLLGRARAIGLEPRPDGLFFAVPSRNLLLLHAIRDAACQDSMNALALRAIRAYQQVPGTITPSTFWWHDGRIETISRYVDGHQTWSVPDALYDILERHCLSAQS
jgi:hypothetical protein